MNYSENLNKAIEKSKMEASRLGCASVSPDLLLLGLLHVNEGRAYSMLQGAGVDIHRAIQAIESRYTPGHTEPVAPAFDKQSERILRILDLETKTYKETVSHTEHLLMAILRERVNKAAIFLQDEWHVNYEAMEKCLPKPQQQPKMGADFSSDLADDLPDDAKAASENNNAKTKANGSKTPALDKFGKDLTLAAEENKLDPVIGRENEIERVVEILSRRKKNNPILIGEPGVGKSAIVEGLALRIVQHQVSPLLFSKRIFTLDIASMVAGTTYRGQFEERMKSVINELQKNPDIILFIDEIHTIIGAGNASGTLDAANILKPALARGEVQCIGATTIDEYRKSVEKDGALERRFQKVMVSPTTREQTLEILRRLSETYGQHHNVTYTDEVLKTCVDLTDRYISDRAFPDKAIDAMDEVGARAQICMQQKPAFVEDLEAQIATAKQQKEALTLQQDYQAAVELRDKELALVTEMNKQLVAWQQERQNQPTIVTCDDVARVVSLMSGVPVQRVQTTETEKLRNMATVLKSRVIGQDEAVDVIAKAIQRSRLGLKDPNRPIGTFFFLGSTGVGKTHLAQCLAEEMFGSKDALIRFDMSEYMEKHTTSLLVGAPPGYVAHEDGGKLTEAVRRKPYSIILFDEIEKAHPDIFNVLLQVLDEGRLTDRHGKVVDFKNTIIILTSNVGTRQLKDFGTGIGFNHASEMDKKAERSVLIKALQKQFPPEFVNRIDHVVTFSKLEKDHLHNIVDLELSGLHKRIEAMNMTLSITTEAKDLLIDQSDVNQYGARSLKRLIQSEVEDALTTLLLNDERYDHISVTVADGKIVAQWVQK
ncbi:MAG: ATP-dependent Clp protease ATP-binding subunit [Paludibacteraceae bacterium]|nr:ATP-dependent Clp protease ATP-binding subunit [Paludibacteraceae bacterium]